MIHQLIRYLNNTKTPNFTLSGVKPDKILINYYQHLLRRDRL